MVKYNKKDKIKDKERSIRKSQNRIVMSEDDWIHSFKIHCITRYKIYDSEMVTFSTDLSNWRIEHDGRVMTLWHESKQFVLHGNDRSSYHIQNVFYDADYCIRSAISHDDYERELKYK